MASRPSGSPSESTPGEPLQHRASPETHNRMDEAQPRAGSQRSITTPAPSTLGPKRRPRRRRNRRGAASAPALETVQSPLDEEDGNTIRPPQPRRDSNFFLQNNLSDTSLDSTALLDHRDQLSMRPRRTSTLPQFNRKPSIPHSHLPRRQYHQELDRNDGSDDEDTSETNETAPLIASVTSLGGVGSSRKARKSRPTTSGSSSNGTKQLVPRTPGVREYGSINFPPSIPGSPLAGPQPSTYARSIGPDDLDLLSRRMHVHSDYDTVIDINGDGVSYPFPSSANQANDNSRSAGGHPAEEDVCFPIDDNLMDEEVPGMVGSHYSFRRPKMWPDFPILEEWSRVEKEQRSEGLRSKKLPEPVYVGGRLRPPVRPQWFKDENDAPYRFTYFNEELAATIHSHTISELLQPGQSFRELFKPEPTLYDDSDYEDNPPPFQRSESRATEQSDHDARTGPSPPEPSGALPRLGRRPTFWLDVLQPTDAEMKVLSRAFGIHPLTVEDIVMQETREKVELFRSYYLVSYRTFEQDSNSEDYMEPVNIYVVVFREGVISFHFSMTPHPANVRRRIRQLKDYINVSADWISYALIDDITDAFGPLIQTLEQEVDDIDDAILRMHIDPDPPAKSITEKSAVDDDNTKSDGDMLKRVGDSRRNVMSLYRLLGNKADVIKGFAKRCNEQWEVAPRSEIGLYLGDIQDHIVTMVSNLNHMEKILSRSHSNYLAQINIKMNERQEQTADVLGRLTVLGTIVLPMNIITGLWGMNVVVPGQTIENLDWFWCITAGLLVFGFMCYYIAKRVYNIM